MTVRDHMTLRLAAARYAYPGARESDARELLGMSPTRFWSRVHALLDHPDALATYPAEVRRLVRLRDARRRARSARKRENAPATRSVTGAEPDGSSRE